jgi:hypothetical protein
MKASGWSLGETILVVVVVWLAAIFVGALAWSRGWHGVFGMEPPELVVISLLVFWFLSLSKKRGDD